MRKILHKLTANRDYLLIAMSLLVSVLLYLYYAPPSQEIKEETLPRIEVQPTDGGVSEVTEPKKIPGVGTPVRFLMMNVQNYFVKEDPQRSHYKRYYKSVESRNAVASVIAEAKPEIVGLVEMGGEAAVRDLIKRLEKQGLRYPHYQVLERMREDRALAILSQHPITEDHSIVNCKLTGQEELYMLRGILDVTIRTGDGRYFRIMGVHLKSKVTDDPHASDSFRAHEARTLSTHILRAIRSEPNMPILVYGDWNAGPKEPSLTIMSQGLTKEGAMNILVPADEHGDVWTIFFRTGSVYSTFDQMYVNDVLKKRMGRNANMGIIGSHTASDHRALWCELR